ncbi:MAG: dihydropteroate synthase-like protein [Methanotrichaceae archaeon]|nr:dihydropteroate synthase-like protein [Methanotrichaceae archaeon]
MKVLAVTGRSAEKLVNESVKGADVLVLDVDIAAFITPEMVINAAPNGYDLIIIPGAITSDFRKAEEALSTKIRLGPKHAADLGFVLKHLDKTELSPSIPACTLLEEIIRKETGAFLAKIENESDPEFYIQGIKIGGNSRMKVLAEIVDATKLSPEKLSLKIDYYQRAGADMIDLGIPLDAHPKDVAFVVEAAKRITNLPVSIDSIQTAQIFEGINAGADMVLSLNGNNLPCLGEIIVQRNLPSVIIPGPGSISLEKNIIEAQNLGIKVIADPVLDPLLFGFAKSLQRYINFNEKFPGVPIFFGVGNVTELLDADTQGANALLASLATEIGASILFTPEFSSKTRGSVRELRIASEMMLLASRRKTPPKDLGFDLLVLKEKRRRPEETIKDEYIEAKVDHIYTIDPAGGFRIIVAEGKIWAIHNIINIVGSNARDLLNTIVELGLVTRLDHAGYLGRELQKAELALRLGRSYSQDEPLLSEKS